MSVPLTGFDPRTPGLRESKIGASVYDRRGVNCIDWQLRTRSAAHSVPCFGSAHPHYTPDQAYDVEKQAVLLIELSGSGREKNVKSGLARRSAEVRAEGFAPAGSIRAQPLCAPLPTFRANGK